MEKRIGEKEYILCHKDHEVLSFSVDEDLRIINIEDIYDKKRVPVGLDNEKLRGGQLEEWFEDRSISEKRTNFGDILKYNNAKYKKELYYKNNSISVSDCYWIRTEKENKKWEDVNIYDAILDFNENIYLGIKEAKEKIKKDKIKRGSPNIMSNGNVPKMWIKRDNKLYLIKGSEGYYWQEPVNEKIISDYMDKLNVRHVKYSLEKLNGRTFCICENMLNKGEELIPAYYIEEMEKNKKIKYTYDSYINNLRLLGLKNDIGKEIDEMILLDYISANVDRHWFNFGVIRDAETLKYKRIAPIYDNGLSLFAKMYSEDIKENNKKMESGSFTNYLSDNLRLVKKYKLLENKNIDMLPEIFREQHKKGMGLEEERINIISENINLRIKTVKKRFGLLNKSVKSIKKESENKNEIKGRNNVKRK